MLIFVRIVRVRTSCKAVYNSYLRLPELSYQRPGLYLSKIRSEILKDLVLELSSFKHLVFVHNDLALDVNFLFCRLSSFVQHLRVVSEFNF